MTRVWQYDNSWTRQAVHPVTSPLSLSPFTGVSVEVFQLIIFEAVSPVIHPDGVVL